MDNKQANALKVGNEVYHKVDMVRGQVVSINPGVCINIKWEDGQISAIHPNGMAEFANG